MGLLDIFDRNNKKSAVQRQEFSHEPRLSNSGSSPVTVFHPEKYSDVENIIDVLKAGKNAVVHLGALKAETSVRILDMLSGAVYALGGGLYELEKNSNIFMLSPSGITTGM